MTHPEQPPQDGPPPESSGDSHSGAPHSHARGHRAPPGGEGLAHRWPPQPPEGAVPFASPPRALEIAFRLVIVGAIMSLLGPLIGLTIPQDEFVATTMPELSPAQEQVVLDILGTIFTVTVVLTVVFAAVFIGLAYAVREGKNWARVTLTVLTAIALGASLLGLTMAADLLAFGGAAVLQGLLNIAITPVEVAILVFLFRPEANQYFRGG